MNGSLTKGVKVTIEVDPRLYTRARFDEWLEAEGIELAENHLDELSKAKTMSNPVLVIGYKNEHVSWSDILLFKVIDLQDDSDLFQQVGSYLTPKMAYFSVCYLKF